MLIYFFTSFYNPSKIQNHKMADVVPLMHFKCKIHKKGRIIKITQTRFWSVIEKLRYQVWIGAFVIFWEFSFLTLPCFSSLLSSKSSHWWCKKLYHEVYAHWHLNVHFKSLKVKKIFITRSKNCILYLKHPNFLFYYIVAWIEIVNVVASLSLIKFHVFIHFIAIIARQKHPTHEFDKKETNIGRAQIMIRLGISPLFWIILLWDTGCMLNSNANNFIYSCTHDELLLFLFHV